MELLESLFPKKLHRHLYFIWVAILFFSLLIWGNSDNFNVGSFYPFGYDGFMDTDFDYDWSEFIVYSLLPLFFLYLNKVVKDYDSGHLK